MIVPVQSLKGQSREKTSYMGVAIFVSALFWSQKLNSNWTRLLLVQILESLSKMRLYACISLSRKKNGDFTFSPLKDQD